MDRRKPDRPSTMAAAFAPLRLGIVGLGDFGRLHARTAARLAETEVVALVDRHESALSGLDPALDGAGRWTDLDRALDESDAEAWIVASSTASHVPVAKPLLEAGRPVLLEKPVAPDLASAESLAPLVAPDSRNLVLGHVALHNSEFRALLAEVAARGPVRFVDAVRHRPVATLDAFPGETPFHLTMVHDLYLVLALRDRAEPVRFTAQRHRTEDGRCDLATAQLQWPDGALATLTASFLTPDGLGGDGFDRLEVFGRNWAARMRPNPRPLELWDDRARHPLALEIGLTDHDATGMLAEQLRCFCGVVRGRRGVPVGAAYEDAMQVQKWLDRLVAAAV